MKATFQRAELLAALKTVGAAVDRRGGSLPILNAVRVVVDGATATLTCTNLERTVTTVTPCGLDSTPGTAYIPHTRLTAVLGGFRATEVTVTLDDHQVALACGRAGGVLNVMDGGDWPRGDVAIDGEAVKPTPEDLRTIGRCLHAASTDKARPVLTGVFFAGTEVACTDSYRLAVGQLDVTTPEMLVPADFLTAVLRDCDGTLSLVADRNGVAFTSGDTTWTTRQLSGDYPQYRNLIRTKPGDLLSVDRDELLEALATVTTIGEAIEKGKRHEPVRLSFDGDEVTLTVIQQGVGITETTFTAGGDWPGLVAFNPRCLAELAGAMCDTETIELDAVDGNKPVVARDPRLMCLTMPVRVS